MATGMIVIDVLSVPELIFALRREMARMLRREAESDSDPRVTRRLESVAHQFECGSTDGD